MIGGTCDPERFPGKGGRRMSESVGYRKRRGETYSAFWEEDIGQRWDRLV